MAEVLVIAASPVVAFFVLRLVPMAATPLADPFLHTAFLVHPQDLFERYTSTLAASTRLREGGRVGFLVPARLAYLAFGPLAGFFVTRYVLALTAIAPVYLLGRRLYGRAMGSLGVIVILSCPVVVTAWGTDYPDSAAISYLIGATALLAMPAQRRRRWWISGAGALLTMAVWSILTAAPLVLVLLVIYAGLRLRRDRRGLLGDVATLAATALAVTAALSVASGVLLGPFDFVVPTWKAFLYLRTPGQIATWHTRVPGRGRATFPYLLALPAVFMAWAVTALRRHRPASTASLLIGLTLGAQSLLFAGLQFFGSAWTLERYYFSSLLWASECLTLTVTLAAASAGLMTWRPRAAWASTILVLAVPLAYEVAATEPVYSGLVALVIGAVVVTGAAVAKITATSRLAGTAPFGTVLGVVLVVAGTLSLNADPIAADAFASEHALLDVGPAYFEALGGNVGDRFDVYRVARTELPSFVGNASYPGEGLLAWWPQSQWRVLEDVSAMYHDGFNSLPSQPPELTAVDITLLTSRRPAELLLLDLYGTNPEATMHALRSYRPLLLRHTVLRSGSLAVHVWLLDLRAFGPAR